MTWRPCGCRTAGCSSLELSEDAVLLMDGGVPFLGEEAPSSNCEIFTFTIVPGDFDGDGDVDLTDYGDFHSCLTGPDAGPVPAGCAKADLDGDDDVDLTDFAAFHLAFTGAL